MPETPLKCIFRFYTIAPGTSGRWELTPRKSIPRTRFASSQIGYDEDRNGPFSSFEKAKKAGESYAREVEQAREGWARREAPGQNFSVRIQQTSGSWKTVESGLSQADAKTEARRLSKKWEVAVFKGREKHWAPKE
jgi:hypothetical protein